MESYQMCFVPVISESKCIQIHGSRYITLPPTPIYETFVEALEEILVTIEASLTGKPCPQSRSLDPKENPIFMLSENTLCLQDRSFFWVFFFDVIQLIVEYRCTNLVLMAHLLELACGISNNIYMSDFIGLMWSLHKSCSPPKVHTYPYTFSHLEQLMYLPYGYAHLKVYSHFDEVKRAATSGNIGLLEVLLNFGVTMLRPADYCLDEFRYTEQVMKRIFGPNFYCESNPATLESWRRFFLMIRILDAIQKIRDQPEYAENYVECIRLLFKSIPDPTFTVEEVENSLKNIFGNKLTDQDISLFCDEFKSHFPESCEPSAPRSLQHLCRFQIRECIRSQNIYFQVGVNSLPLPNNLVRYILLKEGKKSNFRSIIFSPLLRGRQEHQRRISDYICYVLEGPL